MAYLVVQQKCMVEFTQSTAQPHYGFGTISAEQIVKDAGQVLEEFSGDYERMAE